MLNSKTVGNKITEARKKMNLSQSALAQQVAISAQAVGKWERGESMPDIATLNRLAVILGVDLNYFSEDFESVDVETIHTEFKENQIAEKSKPNVKKKLSWDMSESNWENVDFSGLKNLQEKFSSSNVKNCQFIGSDLSGLILKSNNMESCDFSGSTINQSQFIKSHLAKNVFKNCSFHETEFTGSYVSDSDFSHADFTEMSFKSGGFEKNNLEGATWKHSSFLETRIANLVFEGTLEDCFFERCSFSKVSFQNAKLLNCFFKYNELKRIQFVNCVADRITYELLKSGNADVSGISILTE